MFWIILICGIFLVLLQGMLAWEDGYLTQTQMHAQGVTNGYSLMEHGGMWSDVFIISPLIAYLVTHYQFAYTAWWSSLILAIAILGIVPANIAYNKIGLKYPAPHNHDGHITTAGWIHVLFAIAVIWTVAMFYFTPINPPPSRRALITVSSIMTLFFFLGIVDFTRRWVFMKGAKIQLAVQILFLWIVTIGRIYLVH